MEQIASIEWTVYDKIRKINRITASTKPYFEFEYTPDNLIPNASLCV